MLKEIVRNRTIWYLNCVLMLNWIVWIRTVYMNKNGFGIKYAMKPNQTKPNLCSVVYHNLESPEMNVQHSLIRELMHYEFELSWNAVEATKKHYTKKSLDHSTVSRLFKKSSIDCKNLDDKARSCRLMTVNSTTIVIAIEPGRPSCTRRVSEKLGFSQYIVVWHLHCLGKSTKRCSIVLPVTKNMKKI